MVAIARANGLITHMDGARLLNACVATGISAKDMTTGWDSAWIDFSKGLGSERQWVKHLAAAEYHQAMMRYHTDVVRQLKARES